MYKVCNVSVEHYEIMSYIQMTVEEREIEAVIRRQLDKILPSFVAFSNLLKEPLYYVPLQPREE